MLGSRDERFIFYKVLTVQLNLINCKVFLQQAAKLNNIFVKLCLEGSRKSSRKLTSETPVSSGIRIIVPNIVWWGV